MAQRKRRNHGTQTALTARLILVTAAMAALIGCASPGQPKPPSLHLPEVATDLSAGRVGNSVHLRWTTPSSTTDNLPIQPQISAVICREVLSPPDPHIPCVEIARIAVRPGPSEANDALPATLTADPAGLLAYRVELLNAAGRSAGRSSEAFSATGAAPPTLANLVATPIRAGIRLQWTPDPAPAAIQLARTDLAPPSSPATSKPRKPGLGASITPSPEARLSAQPDGQPDAGGTLDQTAQKGATYRYTGQRTRSLLLDGHTVEIHSSVSNPITVKVLSTFPPRPPTGLEAAPGGADSPSIDLSWRPGEELDLAGYNVYRSELLPAAAAGSWQRLNSAPIPVPSFSDSAARAGMRYAYRVTSVDTNGNESAPGNQVQETPGTR